MMDSATKLNFTAWALAEKGKYQQATNLYAEAKSRGLKLSAPTAANCGLFLLCLEKYEEAAAQFREATELADTPRRKGEGSYLASEGVAQWLMGRHREAVVAWRHRVSGIRSGKIRYTDFAGGASDGLLLWYAAVTLKDHDLLKFAMEFFQELSAPGRRSSWPGLSSWPGPLVDLALGAKSAEGIFHEHFDGNKWLGWLRRGDFLQRRKLVNALFYFAVKHRADGQEHACQKMMANVVQIENPLIELEWYLARGELS